MTQPTTPDQREAREREIRERHNKTTGGPWTIDPWEPWWRDHPYYNEAVCAVQGKGYPVDVDLPWEICLFGRGEQSSPPDELDSKVIDAQQANAAFVAHAHDDIPWLLAELDRVRGERGYCLNCNCASCCRSIASTPTQPAPRARGD